VRLADVLNMRSVEAVDPTARRSLGTQHCACSPSTGEAVNVLTCGSNASMAD
jgi:hypothetical protein